MADATAESDACKSRVRNRTRDADEVVKGGLVIDIASIRARLHVRQLLYGVDSDSGHPLKVDDDRVGRHAIGRVGALAAYGNRESVLAAVIQRRHDVAHS